MNIPKYISSFRKGYRNESMTEEVDKLFRETITKDPVLYAGILQDKLDEIYEVAISGNEMIIGGMCGWNFSYWPLYEWAEETKQKDFSFSKEVKQKQFEWAKKTVALETKLGRIKTKEEAKYRAFKYLKSNLFLYYLKQQYDKGIKLEIRWDHSDKRAISFSEMHISVK